MPQPKKTPSPDPLAAALETLHQGVVLRRERLQEVVDDAVRRGRMTRADAEDLVQSLVASGRRQAEDLYQEMERVLGSARKATVRSPVAREVDRARRKVGVPGFPITGYDELTSKQIEGRLGDLGPADLRKVRDHERRHANRKGVLAAIEKRLAT